jgi:hypothetical protein
MACPRGKLVARLGLRKATLGRKVLGVKRKEWETAKRLYLANKSWKAISEETGLNQSTLMSRASREDWTKFRKEMRNMVSSKETVNIEELSKLVRSKLANDAISTLERVDNYQISDIREENTREQVLASISKRSALVFGWSDQSESATVSINLLGALPDKTLNITPTSEME